MVASYTLFSSVYHGQVYVPMNYDNKHWFLLVIHPEAREIILLDSLDTKGKSRYKKEMSIITEALHILFHATGDTSALDRNEWNVRIDASAPKQTNGYDCGIFVMKYMDILSSGLLLKDKELQPHARTFRNSLAYDYLSVAD